MGLQKYGSPEPIEPEADRSQRTAAREGWSADDASAMRAEAGLSPRADARPEDAEVHSHLPADDGVPEIP